MYLGNFRNDEALHFKWSSNDSAGGSITRSTNGTIKVYKNNTVTPSVSGISDTEDFDSVTGVHHCFIDLSSDAFYGVGNSYQVVLVGAVIDGETVNAVLATFSIEDRFEQNAFFDGKVFFDTTGTAGTVYPTGTASQPSSVAADAFTIMTANNLNKLQVIGGFTIPSSPGDISFFGDVGNSFVDLNSKSLAAFATLYDMASVLGSSFGGGRFFRCAFISTTNATYEDDAYFNDCTFQKNFLINDGARFVQCSFKAVDITLDNTCFLYDCSGEITIIGVDHVEDVINIYGFEGKITIGATCTAGIINIYGGSATVIDSSAGTAVNQYLSMNNEVYNSTWSDISYDDNGNPVQYTERLYLNQADAEAGTNSIATISVTTTYVQPTEGAAWQISAQIRKRTA